MNKTGYDILHDPERNKGTAFTEDERTKYKLHGLLPPVIEKMDAQLVRVKEQINFLTRPINRYIYLLQLLDNNERLFFKTIMSDPVSYMPVIYTPTVGEACTLFGHILRRPRGMYISINYSKKKIKDVLNNWPQKDVRFTVVTDGERILGLGDLGISGMGIPIGKLCLYTACAGVPPRHTLPIVLDCGTNNETLLNDPLYLGLKQQRVRGEKYEEFIDNFVKAVNEVFPGICIQWEDFGGVNAINILSKYRDKICTFNDDIQGTAGVILAGLLSACSSTQMKITDHRFLFLGAGAAAIGVAGLLVKVLIQNGKSQSDSYKDIWLFDSKGLVVDSRNDLAEHKKIYAKNSFFKNDFFEAVKEIKPTAIIGLSTVKGSFTREIIEHMAKLNEKPIIFACSNPTSNSECTAEEAYKFSEGRAIFASGSPFEPVTIQNRTFYPAQGNNVFIFPAMGLAVFAAKAKRITDEMFITAAYSLASQVSTQEINEGSVFPSMKNIMEVEIKTAAKIARYIFENGLAGIRSPKNIEAFIRNKMYDPEY
jgi:malate dehydrogenase (oxaloacetate-decarboxylating)(NADP+)